jgi:hypothetical protein
MSHLLNREASPEEGTSLTILREDHIMTFDSSCTSDTGSLLTELSHVETNTGLSLSLVVHNISFIHHHHGAVHLLQGGIIDAPFVLLINYLTLLVYHTEALNFIEGAAEIHLICELVLEHLLVHLVHRPEGTDKTLQKDLRGFLQDTLGQHFMGGYLFFVMKLTIILIYSMFIKYC